MKRRLLPTRSALLVGVMLCYTASLTGAEDLARPPFAVPVSVGTITDYNPGLQAPGSRQGRLGANSQEPRAPFVVLIQDLHANVGVQKNIASIIYRFNHLNQ